MKEGKSRSRLSASKKQIDLEKNTKETFLTTSSGLFDAVYIPGGRKNIDVLKNKPETTEFIEEVFKHSKAIGADGEGVELMKIALPKKDLAELWGTKKGIIVDKSANEFIGAIVQHRFWSREKKE